MENEAALCGSTEPPWEHLDPGIVGAVRALNEEGFTTIDSGDGKWKREQNWEEGTYGDVAHVILTVARDEIPSESIRLLLWIEEQGFEDVELQIYPHREQGSSEYNWYIIMSGDDLYNWKK